jgi:RNA polymerase primary sigma factor
MAKKRRKSTKEDVSNHLQGDTPKESDSDKSNSTEVAETEILPLEYFVNRATQLHSEDEEDLLSSDDEFDMDDTYEEQYDQELGAENEKTQDNSSHEYEEDEAPVQREINLVDFFDPNDPVSLYFREINKVPLLSHDEEIALAKRIEAGREARKKIAQGSVSSKVKKELRRKIEDGWAAREHLVTANFRLVISVAKKYVNRGVPFLDLIQDGNIGLIRATKKFDYRRGFRFSTYATWWIRQAISRGVADHGRTIRLPVHLGDQINRLWRKSQQLTQKLGREATIEELAEVLNESPKKIDELMRVSQRPLSLELPSDDDDNELSDYTPDEVIPAPVEAVTENIMQEHVHDILETLPPREARILQLRYGLLDGKSRTLGEVGKKMGVTRERVRQIEAQAFRRLRQPKIKRELKDYILE